MPTRRVSPHAVALAILLLVAPLQTLGQQSAAVTARIDESAVRAAQAQTPAPSQVSSVPEGFESLTLAPGFLLQMDVYGVPEMSTQLRIDAEGTVTIPLLGPVAIAGNTVAQARETIAKTFTDREILKDPQVNLNILQYPARNVSVMGEVQTPGRIALLAPEPLGDVLALAGGETVAAGNNIEIQHRDANGTTRSQPIRFVAGGDPAILRSTLVEPGDTVLVHRAGIVYVLGAVNRPGGYLMVNGGSLNVVEAVSLAGGETLQASNHWAVIVRRKDDRIEQIKVRLGKMEKGEASAIALEINDALFVPSSGWKSLVINGTNVLSAAAAASIYAASSHP